MSDFKTKMHHSCVGWDFAPEPAGGAYSALPHHLAGFWGLTSKGRGGKGKERKGEGG